MTSSTYLVTGGAGFIGSAVVRELLRRGESVVVLDKLTYAGNLDSLPSTSGTPGFRFERADICDQVAVRRAFAQHRPSRVLHLAAESHVDRSIDAPDAFVQTNIVGTKVMLAEALRHHRSLEGEERTAFRFLHVSTDEVFGSLGPTGHFTEGTPYDPSSPYAASKAASDHLARAWHHTYGLPVLVSNCSNNFGPFQFPEKLIPLATLNAIERKPIPVYGAGDNVRDWLHVDDHVEALLHILAHGRIGETYAVSGGCERKNIEVVGDICDIVDDLLPDASADARRSLIAFVTDRPGHDARYAIDASKLRDELGWSPTRLFEHGLRATVEWYIRNRTWWERVRSGIYRGERLGLRESQ